MSFIGHFNEYKRVKLPLLKETWNKRMRRVNLPFFEMQARSRSQILPL